jgi:DNA-binding GntR family transcriptional regulator
VEEPLMLRFGATRHFIRQALYLLERMGIVVREKNKGAAVRSLTPAEVQQIYDVREMLQRQAALLIRLPAPAALIGRLEAIHAEYGRHADAGYLRGVHEFNDEFHLTLFAGCGNPYLVSSIEYYMRLSLPIRANSMSDRAMLAVSRQHHAVMIELLRGHDNWALAQLCVEHLQPSKREYLRAAASAPP